MQHACSGDSYSQACELSNSGGRRSALPSFCASLRQKVEKLRRSKIEVRSIVKRQLLAIPDADSETRC